MAVCGGASTSLGACIKAAMVGESGAGKTALAKFFVDMKTLHEGETWTVLAR
jgi:ABC-type glutathione transport system ATPase component